MSSRADRASVSVSAGRDRLEMRISHETIYRSLFVQARGELRKGMTYVLRTGAYAARSYKPLGAFGHRPSSDDMVLISDRPAGAADRAVLGARPDGGQGRPFRDRNTRRALQPLRGLLHSLERAGPPNTCAGRSHHQLSKLPTELRQGRSPGTRGKRWPSMRSSPSTPRSPSTSATPTVPGSVV